MKGLKYLAVLLLAVIVYISVFICLLGQSLEMTLLDTDFVTQAIRETEIPDIVYKDLKMLFISEFTAQLTDSFNHNNNDIADIEELQISLILAAYNQSLDNEWLNEQLLNFIKDLLAVVKKEKQEINPMLNIENINQKLASNIILQIDTLLPEAGEILQSDENDTVLIANEIVNGHNIPTILDLTGLTAGIVSLSQLEDMINYYQVFRGIYLYFPFVVVATAFMLACLLTDFSTSFKWIGAGILFSAITFLLATLTISTTAQVFLPEILNIGYSPLTDILISIIKQGANTIFYIPLLGAGVGFIFMVIGFSSHKETTENCIIDSE